MNAVFANHNVKVNHQGIDCLKNWTVLEHFDYCEVERIEIKKGYLLKNRLFICVLGIIIMCVALYFIAQLFSNIDYLSMISKGYWLIRFVYIFIFIFGLALFLKAIIKENVMHIILQDKSQRTILLPYKKKHLNDIIGILKYNNVKVLVKVALPPCN